MWTSDCLQVNADGHLTIGGCDALQLAKKYGTPLYVMDETTVRRHCSEFRTSIEKYYNGKGKPIYASKAFNCLELCRVVTQEGLDLDVVSGGELYTALKAGVPCANIHFHGNNKTDEELCAAIDNAVGEIIVDNFTELKNIERIAAQKAKNVTVTLRIKPGIDAHTHDFIKTGQIDSKFGFSLETGEALEAVKECLNCKSLRLHGLHCHIASQVFDESPFVLAAKVMLHFMIGVRDELGYVIQSLNLGGGFGAKYAESDHPLPYDKYLCDVSSAIHAECEENGFPVPYIYIEPGRSIVCEAGVTLYTVGDVKVIPEIRTYVSVDGGMGDNPRYALYQSKYTCLIADRAGEPADYTATIAGKYCESGDLIQEHTKIQAPRVGDTLAVLSTGAYNYSMASNYNRNPRPAAVMTKEGTDRLFIRKETYEDLLRCDV